MIASKRTVPRGNAGLLRVACLLPAHPASGPRYSGHGQATMATWAALAHRRTRPCSSRRSGCPCQPASAPHSNSPAAQPLPWSCSALWAAPHTGQAHRCAHADACCWLGASPERRSAHHHDRSPAVLLQPLPARLSLMRGAGAATGATAAATDWSRRHLPATSNASNAAAEENAPARPNHAWRRARGSTRRAGAGAVRCPPSVPPSRLARAASPPAFAGPGAGAARPCASCRCAAPPPPSQQRPFARCWRGRSPPGAQLGSATFGAPRRRAAAAAPPGPAPSPAAAQGTAPCPAVLQQPPGGAAPRETRPRRGCRRRASWAAERPGHAPTLCCRAPGSAPGRRLPLPWQARCPRGPCNPARHPGMAAQAT